MLAVVVEKHSRPLLTVTANGKFNNKRRIKQMIKKKNNKQIQYFKYEFHCVGWKIWQQNRNEKFNLLFQSVKR